MEIALFFVTILTAVAGLWNDLNCPAPRSPENGLNFIFRNGELVHFRCHPGYVMKGKAVAYCVNNQWTAPAPECIRIRKGLHKDGLSTDESYLVGRDSSYYSHEIHPEIETQKQHKKSTALTREQMNSNLFNWDSKSRKKSVYGDGPRRVPLINGIWPGHDVKLMALGPQSTPGPMDLVQEEVNIAELRHKQYEEVKKQRYLNPHLDLLPAKRHKGKKRRKNKDKKHQNFVISNNVDTNTPRETVISLGSTEDGNSLSISYAKPTNDTSDIANNIHRYRHHDFQQKKEQRKNKKWLNKYPHSDNIIARSSRVDTSGAGPYNMYQYRNRKAYKDDNEVAELRRLPVQQVYKRKNLHSKLTDYDTSCVEKFYGRDLPMIAQQVQNAFVYRYETKKNKEFPFNSYMHVKYRCLTGFTFADAQVQGLYCREAAWVGETPRCVEQRG